MTVGLLISGNLGNIVLHDILSKKDISLLFVFTDSKSSTIIETCKTKQIKHFVGNPRNGKANVFLTEVESPSLILSINYLFIVEEDIINKATKFAINIHGSLLPKYRGRTPHVWAIINNETLTGITAHLISKGCDEGDIVAQIEVPILPSYTGQDLLNVFNLKYPLLVKEILDKVKANTLTTTKQEESKATYFEKRTAEDGKINFDWQKERIYNWVRAQAKPYPGAFGFIDSNKIIIHKIEFSDFGFRQEMPNGLVLKIENNIPFIKIQNGVIKLIETASDYLIKEGDILK